MDHYTTLGISPAATEEEIKKAYRKLAVKYHPDKNHGDKGAEETFKKIAEAYGILGDPEKKRRYDSTRQAKSSNFSFDDFVKGFGSQQFRNQRNSDGFRSQSRASSQVKTDHLDIRLKSEVPLAEAVKGKKIELVFSRKKIEYSAKDEPKPIYHQVEEERTITIQLNLRKTFILIRKEGDRHVSTVRISKMGHEEIISRSNVWGEHEQLPLVGDLYVDLEMTSPENITIDGNNIVQQVDVPLYKIILKGEKIRIETIFSKKYDAEISQPKNLSDLKFVLEAEGIVDNTGKIGKYIILFNIITPDLSNLSKEEKEKFKELLHKI